jgi:hypothetical protein
MTDNNGWPGWRNPDQRHGVAFGETITATIRAMKGEGDE